MRFSSRVKEEEEEGWGGLGESIPPARVLPEGGGGGGGEFSP